MVELSVAGRLGPVLRRAFNDRRITTQSETTVIRTGPRTGADITDLVRTLVERGLVLQSVHRVTAVRRAGDAGSAGSVDGRGQQSGEPSA